MPTDVTWSMTSVQSATNTRNFNGSTFEFPPTTVASIQDGNHATFVDLGCSDASTIGASTAQVIYVPTTVSLSSGQQIDYVTVQPTGLDLETGNVGTITQFDLRLRNNANSNTQLLKNILAGGANQLVVSPPGVAGNVDWRANINNMRLLIIGARTNASHRIGIAYQAQLLYRRYNRPTLTVTGPGASVTTTLKPTVTWTFSGDGLTQYAFTLRLFTAAQYGAGGFNPETSTATYEIAFGISSANSHTITQNLVPGTTYRAYVMGVQRLPNSLTLHSTVDQTTLTALGSSQYSQFTMNPAAPSTPTVTLPANASTVNTDLPTLGLSMGPAGVSGATVKAEWQMATDAGFTANVRTITEPDTDFRTSGVTTEQMVAGGPELFQGTWFIRGREKDSIGQYGSYSASKTFTVTHPPAASTLSPTGGVTRPFGGSGTVTFSWAFTDTSPTDTQTAFQILVERNSDGLDIYDSGKQVSTLKSFSTNISSTYKDVMLRWSIKLWDSDDVAGSYSATQQFVVRDTGVITPLVPPNAGTVTQPQTTYQWSFAGTGGSTQASYRVVTKQGSTVVDDSGVVSSTVSEYTLPSALLMTGLSYTLEITVFDTNGLEAFSSSTFSALWDAPPAPTVTLDATNYDAGGYVDVEWPENRDPDFVSYKVYRQREDRPQDGWVLAGTITDTGPSTYNFLDYGAPGNVKVYYTVNQVALRFGVPVENAFGSLGSQPFVTPLASHYWVVVPDDPGISFQLALVKSDDFTDEWEQEEILLIGRGRRVERGSHYGLRGNLVAQVYDTALLSAREQRILLLSLKEDNPKLLLRTPFGDVYTVYLGDFQISRLAGHGLNEYFTLTLPYVEVMA